MLKATAGGGGRGIRVVTSEAELTDAYERTSQEAARAFGSGVVFLERLVTGARHVEVQVIADGQGTAWALGVRDCSVQRRNQKVIEESASPVLSPEQAAELKASAERLAVAVGYRGAATVEFLYHPGDKLFAFLEVNTRLQVEHPITECTTGFDLVKAQLHVASGGRLDGEPPVERGHAIEARLNAEDPDRDFAPSPGRIARLDLPAGPGIRVDTGVSEGDTIPADFDSMIAKIIAYGRDRDEALGRLRRAMAETTVIIEGGATNKSFVLDLLDQPEVIDASADTGWIDRVRGEGRLVSHRHSAVALAAAAIEAYEEEERVERQRLLSTAHGGRPQVQHESGRPLDLKLRGVGLPGAGRPGRRAPLPRRHRGRWPTSHTADVELDRFDRHTGQIVVNGTRYRLVTGTHGPDPPGRGRRRHAPGQPRRGRRGALARARAGRRHPAGGRRRGRGRRAGARAGEHEDGDGAAGAVPGPAQGVRRVGRQPGGDRRAAAAAGAARRRRRRGRGRVGRRRPVELDLPAAAADGPGARTRSRAASRTCAACCSASTSTRTTSAGCSTTTSPRAGRPPRTATGRWPRSSTSLDVFADLAELSRNRPAGEDAGGDSHVHSAREYFHTYLQSLDVERAGLPEAFQAKLGKALGHYGVTDLDRTPELEAAVFRIFLAQQRAAADATVVTHAAAGSGCGSRRRTTTLREPAGLALEHLVAATQVRFPVVVRPGARRGVRLVRPAAAAPQPRHASTPTSASHLRHLDAQPGRAGPRRADRRDGRAAPSRWCGCSASGSSAPTCDNAVMLEVLTRRYYGNKGLLDVRTARGRRLHVRGRRARRLAGWSSAAVSFDALGDALRGLAELAGATRGRRRRRHLPRLGEPAGGLRRDGGRAARGRRRAPAAAARSAGSPPPSPGSSGAVMHHHFTFRPSADGMTEERLIRGLHPYIAQRMQLERLRKFDLTRLPSSDEEVYLFQARGAGEPGRRAARRVRAGPRPDRAARARRPAGRAARRPRTPSPPASTRSAARSRGGRRRSASTPTGS